MLKFGENIGAIISYPWSKERSGIFIKKELNVFFNWTIIIDFHS
jgi:hypothetical protein